MTADTLGDDDAVRAALFVCTVGRADSVAGFDRAVAVGVLEAADAVKKGVPEYVPEILEVADTVGDPDDVPEVEAVRELDELAIPVADADAVLDSDDDNERSAVNDGLADVEAVEQIDRVETWVEVSDAVTEILWDAEGDADTEPDAVLVGEGTALEVDTPEGELVPDSVVLAVRHAVTVNQPVDEPVAEAESLA